MITKAIIVAPYEGNTLKVRIPLFESAGVNEQAILDATVCYQPGNLESYKVNDVVFVTFENNMKTFPVIIGKLYLGKDEEPTNFSNNSSLNVTTNANLPSNTVINGVKLGDLIKEVEAHEEKLKVWEKQKV